MAHVLVIVVTVVVRSSWLSRTSRIIIDAVNINAVIFDRFLLNRP